jgi:hypothetical protein
MEEDLLIHLVSSQALEEVLDAAAVSGATDKVFWGNCYRILNSISHLTARNHSIN